jgi:ribokinase
MAHILVSGLINIETSLYVDSFPITYNPARYPFFGINSRISGAGYNIAKALTTLENQVTFLSIVGQDFVAQQIRVALAADRLSDQFVLGLLDNTVQSVIIYDRNGRQQIHLDLKNVQQQLYPEAVFEAMMPDCELFALCNVHFSRPFLAKAQKTGKLIATDVHVVHRLDDEYNHDFMQAANILFMSDELLHTSPESWANNVLGRYSPDILVIGMGAKGALLCVKKDNFMERFPSVQIRPIINTAGAGDALFAAFIHVYMESRDPYQAMKQAIVFASYKIGSVSSADGFLNRQALSQLCAQVQQDSFLYESALESS